MRSPLIPEPQSIRVAGTAPVAVNVTALASAPGTSAITVFVPAVGPSVQLARVATPSEFVGTTTTVGPPGAAGGATMLPLPAVTRKVTGRPAIGAGASAAIGGMCLKSAGCPGLISFTDGAAPTAVLTAAVCGSAEFGLTVPGVPHVKTGLLRHLPAPHTPPTPMWM